MSYLPRATESIRLIVGPPPLATAVDWRIARTDPKFTEFTTEFPSAVETPYPENNIVPLELFIPNAEVGEGSTSGTAAANQKWPVVLILHYLGAQDLRAEESLADDLAKKGMASIVIVLPYHLSRAPEGTRSGQLAVLPDPDAIRQTMEQAVSDARRAVSIVLERPDVRREDLGIAGISLGSLVSELTFAVDPRFRHSAFLLGGVDLAKILWESSRVVVNRDGLRRKGITRSSLSKSLAPIEPARYLPVYFRPPKSSLVVKAAFDTVIPPATTERLITLLNDPYVLRIQTGHYGGIFVQHQLLSITSNFFAREMYGTQFTVPKHLNAPTIRLFAEGMTPLGFDIGIGLDIFGNPDNSSLFGTVGVSPRGPLVFIGHEFGQGFSAGVQGTLRGVGVGIFWSVVL